MSEFAFVFRGRKPPASPEQAQQILQRWIDWIAELDASGALVDRGRPLELQGATITGEVKLVTDGPYLEAKDVVGGFMLVDAATLDDAVRLAEGCPLLAVGGSVEVRPVLVR